MKRILAFLFIFAMSFALWSCMVANTCTNHTDANGDLLCDVCGAGVTCMNHVDNTEDGVYKCDKCGNAMQCNKHVDKDEDNECDKCSAFVPCEKHTDRNDADGTCDKCEAEIDCSGHVDYDMDGECDECESLIPCTEHTDDNKDLKCDVCGTTVPCNNHVDETGNDLKCDICGASVPCTDHVDTNKDLKCDRCETAVPCQHVDANNDGICDVENCKWNYDHTHTYSGEYSSDEQAHWYAPTCTHDIPGKDRALHADDDNNGKCDVCSYQMCNHTFSETEWTGDEEGHWRPATCGHSSVKSQVEPHELDSEGRICSVCNYDTHHEHTYETEWSFTATEHYYKSNCGHSSKEKDRAPHVDENNDGICEICIKQFCDHGYTTVWSTDSTHHWHDKTCTHNVEAKDKAAHTDTDNNGRCDTCDYKLCEHTFEWKHNESNHWKEATCGHSVPNTDMGTHVDQDADILCDVCGYNYGHEHTFNTEEWENNDTHHWHESTCEHSTVKGDYAEHVDVNGDFKCDKCEKFYEDKNSGYFPDDNDQGIVLPGHQIGGNKKT